MHKRNQFIFVIQLLVQMVTWICEIMAACFTEITFEKEQDCSVHVKILFECDLTKVIHMYPENGYM